MSDKIVSTFHERLRKCLNDKTSITATSLADKIGLSKQAISMYASGSRKPKRPTIKAIAEALNVNEAWHNVSHQSPPCGEKIICISIWR